MGQTLSHVGGVVRCGQYAPPLRPQRARAQMQAGSGGSHHTPITIPTPPGGDDGPGTPAAVPGDVTRAGVSGFLCPRVFLYYIFWRSSPVPRLFFFLGPAETSTGPRPPAMDAAFRFWRGMRACWRPFPGFPIPVLVCVVCLWKAMITLTMTGTGASWGALPRRMGRRA